METDMTGEDFCRLTLPNDMGYLAVALGFVRNVAEHFGFTETDLNSIELAVEEATSNVIMYAFPPGERACFDIVCRRIAGGLEVCIQDKGIPWDPALDQDYQPDVELERQNGRGLGRFLIKHLMDEYSYSNLGQNGKQVRMVKYLASLRVGEGVEEKKPEEAGPPSQPTAGPFEFDYRIMQPNEAIEISRAIFDSYGYSYANESFYYPDRIVAMNEQGQMLSAVAIEKESGEIAGHSALLFSTELPPELAAAVTKHKFRGHGIAQKLAEFLDDKARESGLKGVYMKEVTVHPYTQKFAQKLGFSDCGMLLAHSPKTLSFKGIVDRAVQRNSDVLGFKPLSKLAPRELYLPDQHARILLSIYASLEISVTWASDSTVPVSECKTVMKTVINPARSLCEIHVTQYGSDWEEMLKQELRRIRRQEVQLVEMYLSLSDSATPWGVTEAEKLGFFFTGILPETGVGDVIILQYFNGIQVEYDELVIDRSETAKVLEYIKGRDPTMV